MDRFRDRADAGQCLAEELALFGGWPSPSAGVRSPPPLVVGIPRGGVIVAEPVAERLEADFDVLVVEKVGAPWNRELAVGAVGEGDILWLDETLAGRIEPHVLESAIARERAELEEKTAELRSRWGRVDPAGRSVVVVDDGVATGSTVRVALQALQLAEPRRLVLAVPVGPPDTLAGLGPYVDAVVCPLRPHPFHAVGTWYDDFPQCDSEQVMEVFARRQSRNGDV